MLVGTPEGQKRVSGLRELELQVIVSCQIRVLGLKLQYAPRTASAPNHGAIHPAAMVTS